MSFATRIRQYRKANKLTQEQLARKIQVTTGTIRNYEQGRSEPDGERMYKLLASMMGVNELWLRTGEGDMHHDKPADTMHHDRPPMPRDDDDEGDDIHLDVSSMRVGEVRKSVQPFDDGSTYMVITIERVSKEDGERIKAHLAGRE